MCMIRQTNKRTCLLVSQFLSYSFYLHFRKYVVGKIIFDFEKPRKENDKDYVMLS